MNFSEATCCVVDHGRFMHVARRLGRDFAKVYYYTPTERDCPMIRDSCLGIGYPEIERVKSLYKAKNNCNLFVFPDIGFEDEQRELVTQGYMVWGCHRAGLLESGKGRFLDALRTTSLPMPVYEEVVGLTNLRLYLADLEDKYIKIDRFRGDWETMHWTNAGDMDSTLDFYAVRFGPLKDSITFYVFDAIDTEIEDGVDAYCIDGQWPSLVLKGMEHKDKAYLGTMQKFEDVPKEVRVVNEAFGPILAETGMRGFFSTEVRVTKDGQSYFIDPTCRCGSPPSQVQEELFGNYSEIVWRGAQGEMVDPEPTAKFGVQAALCLAGDRLDWNVVSFPPELDQWVKCNFCFLDEGRTCFPKMPEYSTSEAGYIGYLCATGDTIKEAIDTLRDYKAMLPDGVKCEFNSLAELLAEVQSAEEAGMEFSSTPIPEPAEVLEQ